jgi:ABC-2 type transport system permease protein
MKFLRDTQLLFIRNLKKRLTQPLWIILGLMQPVLYLLLYMPLLKNLGTNSSLPIGQITQIFVPGMLIIMGVSCLFAGFGFIPSIREGFITRLLVTPASRFAILLGFILEQAFSLLLQIFALLGISFVLGLKAPIMGILLTLVLVIFIGITMTSFSYVISIVTKDEDGLASMVNTLYLPIMLLSGIMLPISLAPQWLKTAALFNPFYYAVEASRALFAGNYSADIVWQGFLIMGIFAVFAVWLAVRSLRKMAA